jgi:hypothetical protein
MSIVEKYFLLKHQWQVTRRWLSRSPGKPHQLPGQLIVSLTSYPLRFNTLAKTVKCLLTQTTRPDRIILWIAQNDKNKLTKDILSLQQHGLEILYCNDLKSYKKIIPLLDIAQDAFIVTADDDVYYWQTWLEELINEYSGDNSVVMCHRAHKIRIKGSKPLPYNDWELRIEATPPSPLVFPTGMGGVLYPPGIFHPDILNERLFTTLCPDGDDIWLYWMARLKGSKAKKVKSSCELFLWPETIQTSLWNQNKAPEGNDANISAMVEKYGFPK